MVHIDRRDGEHFLTDFYALFSLERFESDIDAIKKAYRAFMLRHNVDRHRGLAGEEEAERMTRLGNRAYETLRDPLAREDYDELLSQWQGPISPDGIPVVHITNPFWSVRGPLAGGQALEITDEEQENIARTQAGDDKHLRDFLRDARDASGRAARLYLRALIKYRDYWRWRLELTRMAGGLAMPELSGGEAATQLRELQAGEREQAVQAWHELRLAIETGTTKALPMGSGQQLSGKALETQLQRSLERFTATTEAALGFAAQYDEVTAELTRPLYAPKQTQFFGNIILMLQIGDEVLPLAFRFNGAIADHVEEAIDAKALEFPEAADVLIANGWNIAYIYVPTGSDRGAVINTALQSHYSKIHGQA